MTNLKVFFDIRDGFSDQDIRLRNQIDQVALWRAKRKYEKEMGVILPRKRKLSVG
jgi:hypothetical protein